MSYKGFDYRLKWEVFITDITKSIPKLDAKDKISGQALYVSDMQMENMIYAKTIRSRIVKGKIKSIDIPVLPEGYFTVSREDIISKNVVKIIFEDMPYFSTDEIHHLNEPIMLVVGPNLSVIKTIADNIKIEYTEEMGIFDESQKTLTYHFQKGNPKKAFRKAEKIIEMTYHTGLQEQAYIEPQGFIVYEEMDKVTLIGSIQCPYYVKNAVVYALGCHEDQVRVIQAAVGGAFGGKEEYPSLIACQLAVAVKKVHRPIKLIFEREEDILSTTKRHPSRITLKAALNELNNVTSIGADIAIDGGAYTGLSSVVLSRAMIAISGAYTFENLDVTGHVLRTNTVPNGAFRGFGAPQMFFAIEMFMHHIAKETHQDAFAFRMRHIARMGDKTSTSGTFRDPILLEDLIRIVTEKSKYHSKALAYSQQGIYKGIGMSFFLHGCGFTGSGESTHIKAEVKLLKTKDNIVHILVAAVDMGQGIKTTLPKIVSNILEIPIENCIFDYPDTDQVPDSGPTVASRTIMIVGGLVAKASKELKETWINQQEQIVSKRYIQPSYIKYDESKFRGDAYPAYSWGVSAVEVSVDPITYQTKILNVVSAYDVGKEIDERIIQGQAEGGITQGIAYGYLENMIANKGVIKQRNLTDYIIPSTLDVSKISTNIIDNPYQFGPFGAKGAGELTLIGGAPAVALAIEMAINKKITKIPVTPEYVMELMRNED